MFNVCVQGEGWVYHNPLWKTNCWGEKVCHELAVRHGAQHADGRGHTERALASQWNQSKRSSHEQERAWPFSLSVKRCQPPLTNIPTRNRTTHCSSSPRSGPDSETNTLEKRILSSLWLEPWRSKSKQWKYFAFFSSWSQIHEPNYASQSYTLSYMEHPKPMNTNK